LRAKSVRASPKRSAFLFLRASLVTRKCPNAASGDLEFPGRKRHLKHGKCLHGLEAHVTDASPRNSSPVRFRNTALSTREKERGPENSLLRDLMLDLFCVLIVSNSLHQF
jgi:hypothetical protein